MLLGADSKLGVKTIFYINMGNNVLAQSIRLTENFVALQRIVKIKCFLALTTLIRSARPLNS